MIVFTLFIISSFTINKSINNIKVEYQTKISKVYLMDDNDYLLSVPVSVKESVIDMDKSAIKKYAVWARRELISRVSQRAAQYEITADGYGDQNASSVHGSVLTAEEKKQRSALITQIKQKGYDQVMEEAAYTWFNRFAALRFMEVNGYLPSHIRVFTNDAGEFKPQILSEAIHLELDGLDMEKVYEMEQANQTEELYRYLLIVQCNALNSILPGMFQRIDDYTELLLPD